MRRSTRPLRRALLVPVALLCLMLAASAPAAANGYTTPPEYQTGQVGHYNFDDFALNGHESAVDCHYHHFSNGKYRLTRFVFRPPQIWWPDNDGGTTHEHGTVGWQYRIQQSTDPTSVPFSTVYTSSTQKHTAHEDHPIYSAGDEAPFTTRQLDWSSHQNVYYRVKYTVTWYNTDGTTRGTLSHWYAYYDNNFSGQVPNLCSNQYLEA